MTGPTPPTRGGRLTYAVAAPAVLATQHAVAAAAYALSGRAPPLGVDFWLQPLRSLAGLPGFGVTGLLLAFAFGLAVSAALAVLSFRRAAAVGRGHVLAALTVAPVLQIPAVLALVLMPRRQAADDAPPNVGADAASIVQGVLAGMALVVFAVFVSTLVFRTYGVGVFALTPCLVGVSTGYIANRKAALTLHRTLRLVMGSLALGGSALIALALEGLVCIVFAAPLAAAMGALGGVIGRSLALSGRRGARPTMTSLAVLPLVFGLEAGRPPALELDTQEATEIAAPPEAVWAALTRMGDIQPPPGPLFRLGLAYPVRGVIKGEGVGAERIGVFSTGEARERITVWSPRRRLEFIVLSNPPMMAEFSPHRAVHAPHVHGYFETRWTRFDLRRSPDGGTRLSVRAAHVLRLDPVLYWAPVVRWGVRQNNARVLAHVRAVAEAGEPGAEE